MGKYYPEDLAKISSLQDRKKALKMLFKALFDCSKPSKCQEGGRASVEQDDGGGLSTETTGNKEELKSKVD